MPKSVLIIDDEVDLRNLLEYNLRKEGYKVMTAQDGRTGIDQTLRERPDLIVLDIMMPIIDGLEVCKTLRNNSKTANIPILMLTAKAEETDKVIGLEIGADDYMVKPFGIRELLARIKALLRRKGREEIISEIIRIGDLTIDSGKRKVSLNSRIVDLTTTEFNILVTLSTRNGRVMERDKLLDEAFGQDSVVLDRTVDVHIASLRRKLGNASHIIETVRGIGYRIKE